MPICRRRFDALRRVSFVPDYFGRDEPCHGVSQPFPHRQLDAACCLLRFSPQKLTFIIASLPADGARNSLLFAAHSYAHYARRRQVHAISARARAPLALHRAAPGHFSPYQRLSLQLFMIHAIITGTLPAYIGYS